MEFNQQFCSVELSKRLKDLNVIQNTSTFVWIGVDEEKVGSKYCTGFNSEYLRSTDKFATFTVFELLELLPANFQITDIETDYIYSYQLTITKTNDDASYYIVEYYCNKDNSTEEWAQENDTLPNCLAKMLIYLIEQGIKI